MLLMLTDYCAARACHAEFHAMMPPCQKNAMPLRRCCRQLLLLSWRVARDTPRQEYTIGATYSAARYTHIRCQRADADAMLLSPAFILRFRHAYLRRAARHMLAASYDADTPPSHADSAC